ncbi:hypothetical protein BOX15_Mlig034341g1 [Macrostomum lignano]|uniref:Kringle domain-containing protein n=2 Tax=Macrostomum lignano TaxID=282301 RepID=A0A267DZY3_9PLAT|nr:hypothetical protein BOX15_Mlig034341g1 [Macrostomum lignano]
MRRSGRYIGLCGVLFLVVALAGATSTKKAVRLHLRNCRQSSDYNGISRCTGAIDGNTNQRWTIHGHSTTNQDARPWWETQVEQLTYFTKVRIFNRLYCCPDRLTNFVIKVDGHVCARYKRKTSFSVKAFSCNRKGRILRIESRIRTFLTLAEVQVYGVAMGPATAAPPIPLSDCAQSSNYLGRSKCTGAIDGNTKQHWTFTGMSTTNRDPRPWWQARTKVPSKIMQVRIFNRLDCCPNRLNKFFIKVDGKVCAQYNSFAAFSVWTFNCNKVGSVVRIESRKATYLTLAEVQVFGEALKTGPRPVKLRLRNCRQSSDYNGISRCTGAIDGINKRVWSAATQSTTNNDAKPWWETQLDEATQIKKVRIFNRRDCCPERLNNFMIKVDGRVCARYRSSKSFKSKTFKCNRKGRVIRIESMKRTYLTLAEVQVFGIMLPQTNAQGLLKLSDCSQSSNYNSRQTCSKAIDGVTRQRLSARAPMAITRNDANPWWEARTEAPARINRVRIFNRQDCCPERLGDFVIKVDDEVCARYNSGPFSVWTFDCNKSGRTVRIESRKRTYLTLAEVQVFGKLLPQEEAALHPVRLKLRNCRQSSDYRGKSRCTGAIDGNTNQRWTIHGHSTTNNDRRPWWEAQTEQVTRFSRVRIFNRLYCCPDRLTNFVIKVDGQVCARYHSKSSFSVKSFNCDMDGRVLRIESLKRTYLTLAEVQVFGFEYGPTSMSSQLRLSKCQQSSNYRGKSFCTGAIDGNLKQSWTISGMSTTQLDQRPWWQAQTDKPSYIAQVRIFNRQDCCPNRLDNFVIKVDNAICAEYKGGPFSVWTLDCNMIGSVVRIESRKRTYLTLAEVQVFGEPANKECYRQQEDFVGSSNVTASGKPCQSWSVKRCTRGTRGVSCHVPSMYVAEAGLTGNNCRNPVDYMRDRPWCYTATPTRWEYCSVPEC